MNQANPIGYVVWMHSNNRKFRLGVSSKMMPRKSDAEGCKRQWERGYVPENWRIDILPVYCPNDLAEPKPKEE